MKEFIGCLGAIARMVFVSLVLSAIFTIGKWVLSLLSICDKPNWGNLFYGAIIIFIVYFVLSIRKAYLMAKKENELKKRFYDSLRDYMDGPFDESRHTL